jgi:hypothetical protein
MASRKYDPPRVISLERHSTYTRELVVYQLGDITELRQTEYDNGYAKLKSIMFDLTQLKQLQSEIEKILTLREEILEEEASKESH